jgi:acyl-CoA reductase-like NAD-dependent aldehyde dehydrogenase
MAAELTHFIGGKHVKGTSGRFGDVYQPLDGTVRAKVPLATKAEVAAASRTPRPRSRPGPPPTRSAAPAC